MKIAVTIPVWIYQNPALIEATQRAVARLRSDVHELTIYLACTRLHQIGPIDLQGYCQRETKHRVCVLHEPGVERSVAGAWNWGCGQGQHDLYLLTANDVEAEAESVDAMAAWGEANPETMIWSGLDRNHTSPERPVDSCDFAFFMLRRGATERFGTFDERYRPAYFEDNDYYTRVVLAGHTPKMIPEARFLHHGSLTTKMEPDAAHHVRHHFALNRARYQAKWGPAEPPGDPAGVLAQCHKTPWNDPSLPITFWDRA